MNIRYKIILVVIPILIIVYLIYNIDNTSNTNIISDLNTQKINPIHLNESILIQSDNIQSSYIDQVILPERILRQKDINIPSAVLFINEENVNDVKKAANNSY